MITGGRLTITISPCGTYVAQFWLFGHMLEKKFKTEVEALCFFENLRAIFIFDMQTIEFASGRYLDTISSKKSRPSITIDKMIFDRFKFYLDTQGISSKSPLAKIRYAHIEGFQFWLKDEMKLKASSVNRYFATLKNFFNKCEKWEYITKNPATHLASLSVKTLEKNVWNEEDFFAVYRTLNKADQKLFHFLKLTGARVSSATRLKWKDIDFEGNQILFKSQKGARAAEKTHSFPLHDKLKVFFIQFETKKFNDYVFLTASSSRIDNKNFSKRISKALRKPEVKATTNGKHLSLHGLRHSLATEMHEKGMTLNEVKSLLGHSSVKVTEGYLRCDQAQLLEKINKIA